MKNQEVMLNKNVLNKNQEVILNKKREAKR